MDIGNNNQLYLYALTSNELGVYETDTQTGTIFPKYSYSISTINNICKLIYDKDKNNLFVSHGINPYYITGFQINRDGSLDQLPGYPAGAYTSSIDDFIFSPDKSFLYALSGTSIYGFNYNSNGSLSPTLQSSLAAEYSSPAEGFLIFDGHILKNDSAGWTSYSIGGDGTLANYASGYNLGAGSGEHPAVSNGYIFKLLLGAGGSNYGFSYNLDIHGIPASAASAISSMVVIGADGGSNINALVKDSEERFLYFVSTNLEKSIYCIRTNTDGTIGTTIDYITTGDMPGAAAIDPYKQFFFTSSSDGGVGWQINTHRMNADLPENSFNVEGTSNQIFELEAVRYN